MSAWKSLDSVSETSFGGKLGESTLWTQRDGKSGWCDLSRKSLEILNIPKLLGAHRTGLRKGWRLVFNAGCVEC